MDQGFAVRPAARRAIVLANATLSRRCLVDGLAPSRRTRTGSSPPTSSIADGTIERHRAGAARRRPAGASISTAAWSGRPSSTCTPISTRATSGRARRNPDGTSSARSTPSTPTATRTGRPPTSRRAWISRCAAPTPTARRSSAPISIRSPPQHTHLLAGLRRDARAPGRPDRAAGASRCSPIDAVPRRGLRRRHGRRPSPRASAASSARVTYHGARTSTARSTRCSALAADDGLDLDFHVDETARSRRALARARSPRRRCAPAFPAQIIVGHCCSLARQPDEPRPTRTIDHVAEAGIAVVSLPMCNMYLQDRHRRPHAALARRHAAPRADGARHRRSPSPPTTRATPSTPMAISTCSRSSARRCASSISTIRSATGRGVVTATPAAIIGRADARHDRAPARPADLVALPRPQLDRAPVAARSPTAIVLRAGKAIDTHACPTIANSTL